MKIKEILFTVLILSICSIGLAQIKFADRMYDENNYESAANQYLKIYKKEPGNLYVIQRLGICYQKMNRYAEAEKYFSKAVKFKEVNPESFLSYGQLLKNNKKINMARTQFEIYIKRKDSKLGPLLLQSCDSIELWTSDATEIQSENLTVVNTQFTEMTPSIWGEKLVFTSDRIVSKKEIDVNNSELEFIYSIYVYDPNNSDSPVAEISKDINTKSNDESHAYFNKQGDMFAYTKVYKGQSGQMELHFAKLIDGKWTDDNSFNRNSEKYSSTNSVLDKNEKTIYFASDKPGGFGGMDIYVSTKKGLLYSRPENLGPIINTSGNEIPSFMSEDGYLYFSSDFHPGFGGTDIFKSKKNSSAWTPPKNLQLPFNSSKDDYGYIIIDENFGYFTSNREGGKGNDDIYSYSTYPFSETDYYKNISGEFTSDDGPLANISLVLLDGNGEIIRTVVTDENGRFEIKNVPSRVEYQILVDVEEEKIPESAKLSVKNDDNGKSTFLERVRKGVFKFEALALDDSGDLSLIGEFDDSGLPMLTVMGQLGSKSNNSVSEKRIYVIDEKGKIIASTLSDRLGQFNFEKLTIDEQYLFRLEEDDDDIDIEIINAEGKVIGRTMKNASGNYVYHKFTINPSANPDIRGIFKFGNLPADGVTLALLDENDALIQFATTDASGSFEFINLNPGVSYQIQVDEGQEVPENAILFLMDKHTGTLIPVSKLANGKFKFETLSPISPDELALMNEEDYVIKPRLNIKGRVTSSTKKSVPSGLEVQLQDENGIIIAVASTDKKGVFKFFNLPIEDQYLFTIPEDDPRFNIQVINADNVVLGEAKKNNNNQYVYHKFTVNPSNHPDIRGLFKYGNLPADDVTLNLLNENDEVLQISKTNALGEFAFKKLHGGKSYRIEVDDSEGKVPDNANMFILDVHTGLMLPVSKLANGQFKFETLNPMEPEALALMDDNDNSVVRFSFFARLLGDEEDIGNKEIQVINKKGRVIAVSKTDKYGRFNYENLPLEDEYLLRMVEEDAEIDLVIISKDGKELGILNKNDDGDFVFRREELNKKIEVTKPKIIEENVVVMETISGEYKPVVNFSYDGYELNIQSKRNLDFLAEYLIKNPDLKLEINSHTDSRGTSEYNMFLSRERAENVKEYLANKGVENNRIIANSFGETQLLNECSDGVNCPDEKHAENRRVDLRYIK